MRRFFAPPLVVGSMRVGVPASLPNGITACRSFNWQKFAARSKARQQHHGNNGKGNQKKTKAVGISADDFRVSVTVVQHDDVYLRKHFQRENATMDIRTSRDEALSGFWRSTMRIPVTHLKGASSGGGRPVVVEAIGLASSKQKATAACKAHACDLLDYHSVSHSDANSPAVPKLWMIKNPQKVTRVEKEATKAVLSCSDPRDPKLWAKYVSSCEAVIEESRTRSAWSHHIAGGIPLSDDWFIDEARSHLKLRQQERGGNSWLHTGALQELRGLVKRCGSVLPDAATSVVNLGRQAGGGRKMSLCRFTLPVYPYVTVEGVGDGASQGVHHATLMAAMMGLRIIRMALQHTHPTTRALERTSKDGEKAAPMSPEEAAAAAAAGEQALAEVPKALLNLSGAQQSRLMDIHARVTGVKPPMPTFTFDIRTNLYACEIKIGDVVCERRGINRGEAERAATSATFETLIVMDPTVRSIAQLLLTHEHLEPNHITRLVPPPAVEAAVADLVRDEPAVNNDATIAVERRTDRQTETLLEKMTARRRRSGSSKATDEANVAMQTRLKKRLADETYKQKFGERRASLAMASAREEILTKLESSRVVVISGTTGCGKTTQVPQFILDAAIERGEGADCTVLVTQPRRISAITIAERIAAERLQRAGEEVGHTVRLSSTPGSNINLVTVGVLLQMMISDRNLDSVKYLILDEVHERDINVDFAMILVKRLLRRNKHIKVLLMSATLRASMFASYFGENVPIVTVEGRLFPVKIHYWEEIRSLMANSDRPYRAPPVPAAMNGVDPKDGSVAIKKVLNFEMIARLIDFADEQHALSTAGRSVLVFLPGWFEMKVTREAVMQYVRNASRFQFVMLHSSVSSAEQLAAFRPALPGMTKVILATNIAESGVTIDDAAVVIDTGMIREMQWSLLPGSTEVGKDGFKSTRALTTVKTSQANCTQRTGRAGRTQGGTCYRLYSKRHYELMAPYQTPQLSREPLHEVMLKALAIGHNPMQLLSEAIDPPPPKQVEASLEMLIDLGAVEKVPSSTETETETNGGDAEVETPSAPVDVRLTSLGQWLSILPTSPQVGKMIILGAMMRCLDPVLTIAAAADLTPFRTDMNMKPKVEQVKTKLAGESYSSHIATVNAYNNYVNSEGDPGHCEELLLNPTAMMTIGRYKRQFYEILWRAGFLPDAPPPPPEADAMAMSFGGSRAKASIFVDTSVYSENYRDVGLVKACVCSGQFPKVGITREDSDKLERVRIKTHASMDLKEMCVSKAFDGEALRKGTSSPFLIYSSIFLNADTKKETLQDATNVTKWQLILFGASNAHIRQREDINLGVIDDWLLFTASPQVVGDVQRLKRLLDRTILKKLQDPSDHENTRILDAARDVCRALVNLPVSNESSRGSDADAPKKQKASLIIALPEIDQKRWDASQPTAPPTKFALRTEKQAVIPPLPADALDELAVQTQQPPRGAQRSPPSRDGPRQHSQAVDPRAMMEDEVDDDVEDFAFRGE